MAVIADPNALGPWVPGTDIGVVGGIPTRPSGGGTLVNVTASPYFADNTGATDAGAAIQAAYNAATANSVIYCPAGTYKMTTAISIVANSEKKTIRGAGWTTIFDSHVNECFKVANGDTPYWDQTVTAGITKGSTVVQVGDTTNYAVGQMMIIHVSNDTALPIINIKGYDFNTLQTVVITSKDSTHIHFYPALYDNFGSGSRPVVVTTNGNNWYCREIGIEDLLVDGQGYTDDHPGTGAYSAVTFTNTLNCWIKNVRTRNFGNYHIVVASSCHSEVRRCWIGPLGATASNNAGLLFSVDSAALVEDNIHQSFMEANAETGCVYSRNYWHPGTGYGDYVTGVRVDTNHACGGGWNLYEANVASNIIQDGYFGNSQNETFLRNNFPGYFNELKRFTRNYAFVGNFLWPAPAATFGVRTKASMGLPNIGNWGYDGTAHFPDDPWRDYNLTGTITTAPTDDRGTDGTCNNSTAFHSGTITFNAGDAGVTTITGPHITGGTIIASYVGPHDVVLSAPTTGGPQTTEPFFLKGNARGGTAVITMNSSIGSMTDNFDWVTVRWNNLVNGKIDTHVVDVTGLVVTMGWGGLTQGDPYPAAGTAVVIFVWGPVGWQEIDTNVAETTTFTGNRYLDDSSFESLGGDTIPDSYIYGSTKPAWLLAAETELGTTFDLAAFRPESTTTGSATAIPAAVRYAATLGPAAPVNTTLPTVGGSATVGGTMTFTRGSWSGSPTPTLTSILRRCNSAGTSCLDISPPETGISYVLQSTDVGSTIRIRVTGTNTEGSATADSAASALITAGGTTYTQSFTAGLSLIGEWLKSYTSGAIAPTGWATLNVRANKALTATGSFVVGFGKSFIAGGGHVFTQSYAATLSFAVVVSRRTAHLLTATKSFSGAATKRITDAGFSATTSFVTTAVKRISDAGFAATLSLTGFFASSKSFLKSLAATLSFTGAIAVSKSFLKSLTATLSRTATLQRSTGKAFNATFSTAASLIKRVARVFSGIMSPAGTLFKAIRDAGFTATLSFVGNLVGTAAHFFTRILTATLSFAGSLTRTRTIARALTATLTFAVAIRRQTSKSLTATINFSTVLGRTMRKVFVSVLHFIGFFFRGGFLFFPAGIKTGSAVKAQKADSQLRIERTD